MTMIKPMPATMPATTHTTHATNDDIETVRRRTLDKAYRCLRRILSALARDHEHCGKAACLRSRRCRGFACAPGPDAFA